MTGIAILLLIASAFVHAGWNLLGKRRNPTSTFFLLANLIGTLLLTPVILWNWNLLPAIPAVVWMWLALTGMAQALYYAALAGAYRRADLSIVYPLARSYPILVVLAVSFLLGRRDQISLQCVAGIVLLVTGCFFLPKQRFTQFHWRDYVQAGALLAMLAACGSAGYSLCDDEALRVLRSHWTMLSKMRISLMYGALEAWTSTIALAVFVCSIPGQRTEWRKDFQTGKQDAFLMGIGIYLAYILVLIAMGFARNISYVVAFRLLGIPLAALLGVLILRESRYPPKFVGVALMFIGLILVATG